MDGGGSNSQGQGRGRRRRRRRRGRGGGGGGGGGRGQDGPAGGPQTFGGPSATGRGGAGFGGGFGGGAEGGPGPSNGGGRGRRRRRRNGGQAGGQSAPDGMPGGPRRSKQPRTLEAKASGTGAGFIRGPQPEVAPSAKKGPPSFMSKTRCDTLRNTVSPQITRALLEVFQFEYLTEIQEAAIPVAMTGADILARAKTGTGKTIGFLIPTIDKLLRESTRQQQRRGPGGTRPLSAIVLSPTRELAAQIANEGKGLLRFTQFELGIVVGGTNRKTDVTRLSRGLDILVATPGRLLDHLQNTDGVAAAARGLRVLVMDEADQLLEMGFQPDIKRILKFLPPVGAKQTMLFSATVPSDVKNMCDVCMRRDFKFINTVKAGDTNVQVRQEVGVVPFRWSLHHLASVVFQAMRTQPNFKIIVFLSTARVCGYYAELFRTMRSADGLRVPVLEIHSRKSQGNRTATSKRFREGSNMVLFTSDVSARGVDYPDVTLVVQVGMVEKATYIHRLGRTARIGKAGRGLILLSEFEAQLMRRRLQGLPLKQASINVPDPQRDEGFVATDRVVSGIRAACEREPAGPSFESSDPLVKASCQAYQAWLGFYNGQARKLGWSSTQLVEAANAFAQFLGLTQPPPLRRRTVGKMGLKGVRGLRLE